MNLQYKIHILNLMEVHSSAIFYVKTQALDKLDRLQRIFVHALNVTEDQVFLRYNLAPLCLRRDISVLGFRQKCALKEAHPALQEIVRLMSMRTRLPTRHDKQIESRRWIINHFHDVYSRSIFNMAFIYNMLPQHVVDLKDVYSLQTYLIQMARTRCESHNASWIIFLSARTYDTYHLEHNLIYKLR